MDRRRDGGKEEERSIIHLWVFKVFQGVIHVQIIYSFVYSTNIH